MEGGSEREGKVFCASPPPHQSKGEMSQPKGGKNITDPCTTTDVQSLLHAVQHARLQPEHGRCILKLDGLEGSVAFPV